MMEPLVRMFGMIRCARYSPWSAASAAAAWLRRLPVPRWCLS